MFKCDKNFKIKRLQGELKMIQRKQIPGFTIEPISETDVTKLKGTFEGFQDSSYDKGFYEVHFIIPDGYPQVPPKAYFKTKVWHPNISSATGCICMSLLSDKWTFSDNLLTIIQSIQALLVCPQPDDPQDLPVATQFINNKELFDETAAFWNYHYAGGVKKDYFEKFTFKINNLCAKGFDKDKIIHTLSMKDWITEQAIAYLTDN